MNFTGVEQFDCEQAELWARLTDMGFVSRMIPDVDRVERLDATGFACRVRPRFSFLTGSLDLVFEVIDPVPQERLKVRTRGKGIGAAVVVEAEMQLLSVESGTELRWTGTIASREGLLKPVSAGLIEGAARRVIETFWKKFREAIEADGNSNIG